MTEGFRRVNLRRRTWRVLGGIRRSLDFPRHTSVPRWLHPAVQNLHLVNRTDLSLRGAPLNFAGRRSNLPREGGNCFAKTAAQKLVMLSGFPWHRPPGLVCEASPRCNARCFVAKTAPQHDNSCLYAYRRAVWNSRNDKCGLSWRWSFPEIQITLSNNRLLLLCFCNRV